MMKILGTGLTGLVGSRVVELLSDKYAFENISTSTGVDITNREQVMQTIAGSDAPIIIHSAAKTDVDGCEKEKDLGKESEAWRINVEGTRNVADACKQSRKKLIYISTDFVFDGEQEFYTEEDIPNPVNWYAKTKYEGEKVVQDLAIPWIIIRPAYPYRAQFPKKDFMRAMLGRMQAGEKVVAVADHIFTPTFIDDIASALDLLLKKEAEGIYHVVGSSHLNPYEAALEIAKVFSLPTALIEQTIRTEFFQNRALRPFRLALKNDKISTLGFTPRSFMKGLEEVKRQQENL